MTPPLDADRWQRVNTLFDEATALPIDARAAFLDDACRHDAGIRRELESLLACDAPQDRALDMAYGDALAAEVAALDRQLPIERIGHYRLLSQIGSGGMGTVYLAERDGDFQQRVAIKVVRGLLDRDGLRRFRAERQILASLEHASIARLFDGGTTPEGLPYLVMEHIDGVPIDTYCETHGLSVRERLALFCRVAEAVSHAHRSLVVHRDLKPSNILITADRTPKLLDFGIAKLLEADGSSAGLTTPSMRVLTPEYASPEQIRGEPITTAADVYSLGVLLFELLTGERPHRFDPRRHEDLERIVCGQEAPRPSAVGALEARRARELAGDLDTIVLAALHKDRVRRYASVDQLAEDVERYLAGLPIRARPSTWRYRSVRFVRRHRATVAAAAVFVVVVLGFTIALATSAARIARERDVAARERDTSEAVTAALVGMFSGLDPGEARGNTITAREILERGTARVNQELKGQPDAQARLLDAIGSVYVGLGLWNQADGVLNQALAARRAVGDGESVLSAHIMSNLAESLIFRSRHREAEPLARGALDIRRRLLGPRHADVAASLTQLARILANSARPADAEPLHAEAAAIWRETRGPNAPEVATSLHYLASERRNRGEYDDAERMARQALAIRRASLGNAHPDTAFSLDMLGKILDDRGADADAEVVLREALAVRQTIYPDGHPFISQSLAALGTVLQDQGKYADAEPLYRRGLELSRRRLGVHGGVAANLSKLAQLLEDTARFDEAEAAHRESLGMRRQLFGPAHPAVAATLADLARMFLASGRPAAALPLVDQALQIRRAGLGAGHIDVARAVVARANVLAALGRAAEAESGYREGLAGLRKILPPQHPDVTAADASYARFSGRKPRG